MTNIDFEAAVSLRHCYSHQQIDAVLDPAMGVRIVKGKDEEVDKLAAKLAKALNLKLIRLES